MGHSASIQHKDIRPFARIHNSIAGLDELARYLIAVGFIQLATVSDYSYGAALILRAPGDR
jgi:hypothetical protein